MKSCSDVLPGIRDLTARRRQCGHVPIPACGLADGSQMLLPGLGVQQMVQAHGIATPAAQQAPAKCSSAADTAAAALLRKMAMRGNYEGIPR